MPRGRPVKCIHCGSTDTTSKGARHTKTMGIRKIRRCKSCGRRFTPKHQKNNVVRMPEPIDPELSRRVESESTKSAESDSAGPVVPAAVPSVDPPEPSDEHPRFGL